MMKERRVKRSERGALTLENSKEGRKRRRAEGREKNDRRKTKRQRIVTEVKRNKEEGRNHTKAVIHTHFRCLLACCAYLELSFPFVFFFILLRK